MEPVGLALGVIGLSGLFDTCLKLYQHVSDAKRYPKDCQRLALFLGFEQRRFELVRAEVMQGGLDPHTESTEKPGSQIDQSPDKNQHQSSRPPEIEYLGQLLNSVQEVLNEAQNIIARAQKPESKRTLKNLISARLHTRQLIWVADDKNRLKELVEALRQLNGYIEHLLPASYRRRLQLGFGATVILAADMNQLQDIQAESSIIEYESLHRAAAVRVAKLSLESDSLYPPRTIQNCRIDEASIQLRRLIDKSFNIYSTAIYETSSGGTLSRFNVLLERRQAFTTADSITAGERRLNGLVTALQSMGGTLNDGPRENPVEFGGLRCLGWMAPDSSDLDAIELVYQYPCSMSRTPKSLHNLLQCPEPAAKPSLGVRFNLAHRLVQFYGSYISVGYLHKGLHSHNVLFFDETFRPYIAGCTESRPETTTEYSSPLSNAIPDRELYLPWEIIQTMGEADCTRRTRWSPAADIYGLGVMLAEIAHWTCASQVWKTASLYEFHHSILPQLSEELGYHMGDIYKDVVKICLRVGEFGYGSEFDAWQNYSDKVLKPLESCRA